MSNALTPQELTTVKEALEELNGADLSSWEEGFIATVTEQVDAKRPWLTAPQREKLEQIRDQKS